MLREGSRVRAGDSDILVARDYSADLIVVIRIQSHPWDNLPLFLLHQDARSKTCFPQLQIFLSFLFFNHPPIFWTLAAPPLLSAWDYAFHHLQPIPVPPPLRVYVCSWGCALPERTKESISLFPFFRWGLLFPLCVRLLCSICCVGCSALPLFAFYPDAKVHRWEKQKVKSLTL